MQLRNKKHLIIDTETSGLPMCRPKTPKHMKYPNPKFAIAYEGARLLSLAFICSDGGDFAHLVRNNSDLNKSLYQTNSDKFPDNTGTAIGEILDVVQAKVEWCDYIIGHNVLFDINIIAHEAFQLSHPLYQILMDKIAAVEYFCTMDAAARMGIASKDLQLRDVYNFMNDGPAFSNQKLEFHNALDDVRATKVILDRIMSNSFTIPAKILEIMDEIYPPVKFGLNLTKLNPDLIKPGSNLILSVYLSDFGFEYYKEIIKYESCTYNAAGLAIFHGVNEVEIANIKFFTRDGVYRLRSEVQPQRDVEIPCYYSDLDIIFACEETTQQGKCGKKIFGFEICDSCADSSMIFEAYYEMLKVPFNIFNTYTTAEVKNLIPKDKPRRSGTIALEVKKRGRSNTVSADIVNFYIANKIYNYFSLTIGTTKL